MLMPSATSASATAATMPGRSRPTAGERECGHPVGPARERELRPDDGAPAGGALDLEPPAERLDRSASPPRPEPELASAPPRPSSTTSAWTWPSRLRTRTVTDVAPAYFAVFVSASEATK